MNHFMVYYEKVATTQVFLRDVTDIAPVRSPRLVDQMGSSLSWLTDTPDVVPGALDHVRWTTYTE